MRNRPPDPDRDLRRVDGRKLAAVRRLRPKSCGSRKQGRRGRIHAGPGYAAAVTHSTSLPAPLVAAIDQVWLRCAVLIACAIGIAMVAIGVATYLMAVESDVAAWVLFALSG